MRSRGGRRDARRMPGYDGSPWRRPMVSRAARVPRAFEARDFDTVFVGYVVMRASIVTLWLRAGHHDHDRRATAHRTAAGMSVCMVGWAAVALAEWPLWAFVVVGAAEMLVP